MNRSGIGKPSAQFIGVYVDPTQNGSLSKLEDFDSPTFWWGYCRRLFYVSLFFCQVDLSNGMSQDRSCY